MDVLHTEMVRQMEESEEAAVRPSRKESVSTACQTEKVSRKVSHAARLKESPGPRPLVSEEMMMTPVTRATTTHTARGSERTGVAKLREELIFKIHPSLAFND